MGNQKTIINSAQQKGHTKVERFFFFPFFLGGGIDRQSRWSIQQMKHGNERKKNKQRKQKLPHFTYYSSTQPINKT